MPQRKGATLCATILALILAAGCASSGAGTNAAVGERETQPRMISRLRPPALRISSIPTSGRSPIRVRFEVLVDTEGRPDMRTFKVTGMGAPENHDALATWIQQSMFAPATRGGINVPGVYKGSLQVRLTR
jgi:hypothetical protein